MAFLYPWGNTQQLNLDWILQKIKELEAGSGGVDLDEVATALLSASYAQQAYDRSDIVFRDGKLYRANQAIPAPGEAWTPAHWDEILLGDTVSNLVQYVAALSNDQIANSSSVSGTHTSNALDTLNGAINDKVSKSGDTMTGALQAQTAYVSNGSYSSNQWATEIYFKDANNVNIGQVRTGHMANGDEIVELFARRNVSGSDVFNSLRLGIKSNGDKYIEFNATADAKIWRKALGLLYAPNDTLAITSSLVLSGEVAKSGNPAITNLAYVTFNTDKSIEDISIITATVMVGRLYGINGAIIGTNTNFLSGGYSVSCVKQDSNTVRIAITSPSELNATPYTPLTYFGTLTLKFT